MGVTRTWRKGGGMRVSIGKARDVGGRRVRKEMREGEEIGWGWHVNAGE